MPDTLPSPAAVVYGTADLFAPPAARFGYWEAVPCTDHKVVALELATQLICATLADLTRQGMISLQIVEATKMLVIHTKNVVVHVAPDFAARMPQSGLAGWLSQSILRHIDGNIHNIIWSAYSRDYPSPSSVPIHFAVQELIALEYYADTVREIGGLGGMLRKAVHASTTEHVPVPIPERFATLRTYAPYVQQMLQTASAQDPALWEMLHKQVSHAITSRTESTDNTAGVN